MQIVYNPSLYPNREGGWWVHPVSGYYERFVVSRLDGSDDLPSISYTGDVENLSIEEFKNLMVAGQYAIQIAENYGNDEAIWEIIRKAIDGE